MWNEREAREDFLRVAHLDPAMAAAVKKELKLLGERMRKKHVEDRKRYQGLFQQPRGGRAGVGGGRQEEVVSHGEEQGTGMGEAGGGEGGGKAGDGCGKEARGRGTAPGEAEVVGNGVGEGGGVKLGACRAELESCGAERELEGGEEEEEEAVEEEEGKVMVEEEEKEMVEKEEEVVKEAVDEEEKTTEEEQEGKKEAVEGEEEREKETVEGEEEMGEKEKRKETVEGEEEGGRVEEDEVEEVEAVVEEQEGKKETVEEKEERKETVEREEEKEKLEEEENSAAEMEKLAVGQHEVSEKGELMQGQEADGAEGADARSMAGEESGRAAELAPAYLDQRTAQGELGQGSCGGQRAHNFPITDLTNGGELQVRPSAADEDLDGGIEVPSYPTPAKERDGATSGAEAPLEQCGESRELEAVATGHGQA